MTLLTVLTGDDRCRVHALSKAVVWQAITQGHSQTQREGHCYQEGHLPGCKACGEGPGRLHSKGMATNDVSRGDATPALLKLSPLLIMMSGLESTCKPG